jgi:hypothetical protein
MKRKKRDLLFLGNLVYLGASTTRPRVRMQADGGVGTRRFRWSTV